MAALEKTAKEFSLFREWADKESARQEERAQAAEAEASAALDRRRRLDRPPFLFRPLFFASGVFISDTCDKDSSDRCRVEMSFPSGARAAVGLPSVPPQRLIRNDCSSRDTRSRGCTANLRHKIAKGAVAQDSEHIRSCTVSH